MEAGQNRDNCRILVLAPTGKAAYNVKGSTIHAALHKLANTEWSHNLDRSFRNIYIVPSFPTREQHAHSVQNARSRFNKLNQSYSC